MLKHPTDLLPLMAAGSTSEDERETVGAHLHSCADCTAELEQWRAVAAATRSAESLDVLRTLMRRS